MLSLGDLFLLEVDLLESVLLSNLLRPRIKTHRPIVVFAVFCSVFLLKLLNHCVVFFAAIYGFLLDNLSFSHLGVFLLHSKEMFTAVILVQSSWWKRRLDLNGACVIGSTATLYVWLRDIFITVLWSLKTWGLSFIFATQIPIQLPNIFHRIDLRKSFLLSLIWIGHNTQPINGISARLWYDWVALLVFVQPGAFLVLNRSIVWFDHFSVPHLGRARYRGCLLLGIVRFWEPLRELGEILGHFDGVEEVVFNSYVFFFDIVHCVILGICITTFPWE